MLVHLADEQRTFLLEGPCRAPRKAKPEDVRKSNRSRGYRSIAVPTYPAVIGYANRHYGALPLADLAEPAIDLAESGYRVTPYYHRLAKSYLKPIRKGNAATFLLDDVHEPPQPGTLKRNDPLARTLRRLGRLGAEDFYVGRIGQRILADMEANRGFVCKEDLVEIPWPAETAPLEGEFGDHKVYTTPPPGGGFVLVEMLHLFDAWAKHGFDPDSTSGALIFTEIIRRARLDRRKLRLELTPEWVRSQPMTLSREYAVRTASELISQISNHVGETSHLNVIDRDGNVVALTQSIERSFGAKVATPELGFLYNGFMAGFKIRNKRHPHYLQPGAVARSNTSPALLIDGRGRKVAIGSTGSERIASGIFQVLVRLLSQSRFESVRAQRLHCTPERQVFYEPGRIDQTVLDALRNHGMTLVPHPEAWAFSAGGLHLAGDDGTMKWGVADPRRDGLAAAPRLANP